MWHVIEHYKITNGYMLPVLYRLILFEPFAFKSTFYRFF